MALYKAEGLLLRTYDLGEADKILVLYTRERGKVSCVARGARRAKSRFLAVSQLFSHSRFLIYQGRSSLHTVRQAELINSFRSLREDLVRVAHASYASELLDHFVAEWEPQADLFRLLLETMTLLSGASDLDLTLRWYELRLMDVLGYRPVLDACVTCGGELRGVSGFSAELGGTLCHSCLGVRHAEVLLQPGTLQLLRRLLDTPATRLRILRPSAGDRIVMEQVTRAHIDRRISRTLKAREFLDSVKELEAR